MTNLRACVGLFVSLQKILEELWKIHASLPHASLRQSLYEVLTRLNNQMEY